MGNPVGRLAKASFVAIGIFAAVEMSLRLVYLTPTAFFVYPPRYKQIFKPLPGIMPGIAGESRFITNSMGIRGDEIPNNATYRILAIGGSATESTMVDQQKTWPYLLQTILNTKSPQAKIWVGNIGKSSLNTRHHILEMKYFVPQVSVDTIVMMIGVNDVNRRLAQDMRYVPMTLENIYRDEELYQTAFWSYPDMTAGRDIIKSLALYRAGRSIKHWWLFRTTGEVVDEAGKFYTQRRANRQNAAIMRSALPDLTASIAEYEQNINEIINLAGQRSHRIILLTQPTMWKSDMSQDSARLLWFGGIGNYIAEPVNEYYATSALASAMSLYNAKLLDVCSKRSVECIDLAPQLSKDTSAFFDDCHFNESGSQKVADILAEYFLRHPNATDSAAP